MTTSGTTAFNLDVVELAEEAFERAGLEMRSGYDLRTARRSLNLLSAEWSNKGLNLWTVVEGTTALVAGQATYSLPEDTIDLIEQSIRVSQGGTNTDYRITRIGVGTYAGVANKAMQARPQQIYVERTTSPTFTLWPVPDQAYTMLHWRMRRMEDAATGANTMDMPVRFIPALAAGLAYHIALKRPEAMARVQLLKADYDEQFALAAQEDRGRESTWLVPWVR